VYVKSAEEGDVLEVRIIDVSPRPSAQREVQGQELWRECRGLVGLPLQGADHPSRRTAK
jgi:acetamidase/formamidase